MNERSEAATLKAWYAEVAPGQFALIAHQSLGHLLDEFSRQRVPLAPAHANGIIYWHGVLLPVLRLDVLLGGGSETPVKLVGVVAFHGDEAVLLGGLGLFSPPRLVEVPAKALDEAAEAEVESELAPWASSWVELVGRPVPVLDLDKLFQ